MSDNKTKEFKPLSYKMKSYKDKLGVERPTVVVSGLLFVNNDKTPGSNQPDYKTGSSLSGWYKSGQFTDKNGLIKEYSGISLSVQMSVADLLSDPLIRQTILAALNSGDYDK
jgi:hypothetical protein